MGFLLCTIVFCAGYWSFSKEFENQYDATIRAVATTVRECLNPEDFSKYIETGKSDERYDEVKKILQYFVDKFDLNLLYVSVVDAPDYTHITYIYNPVKVGGQWQEYPLGYSEVYKEAEFNESAKNVFEHDSVVVRHTLKSRSGSHITAMLPVKDSTGKTIAVIGAQKSVQQYVSARYSFANVVVVVEILFALLSILVFGSFFNKRFIHPIMLVSDEAARFAKCGGSPSDKLLSIRKKDEIGTLASSVHKMEYDVFNNIEKLTKVTAEKERFVTELDVATKIQSDMLPKGYPAFPNRKDFDLFAIMLPAKEVGGDLYDYKLIDGNHLLIVVGDVSGKGVPAALFMVVAKTFLGSYAEQGLSPAEIFSATNNQLCNGNDLGYFVTCWLGVLDLNSGELRFVNAGHPNPVLYHDGEYKQLTARPNFILGIVENTTYTEQSITMSKGDRLFVFTDGVNEANNPARELFGFNRLLEALNKTDRANPAETCELVKKEIDAFVGDAPQFDDITMLSFEFRGRMDAPWKRQEIKVPASPDSQAEVMNLIKAVLEPLNSPVKTKRQISIAADEIFSNIANYSKATELTFVIEIHKAPLTAKLYFIDNGAAFDPLQKEDPDIALSVMDRGVGGLGVYIVKKTMDDVSYRRDGDLNELTIVKRL